MAVFDYHLLEYLIGLRKLTLINIIRLQVWWGVIKEGEAPKQIVEDGEFFVLKRIPSTGGGHH